MPETRPRWCWADTATPWPTPCPRCGGRLFEHPKSNCEDPACERCGKPNVACEFLDCSFTYMCTTALGQVADLCIGQVITWEQFEQRPDLLVRLTLLGHEYGRRKLYIGTSDDGCGFRFAGRRGDFCKRHIQMIEVAAIGVPPCDQAELDRRAKIFEIRDYLMTSGDDGIWLGQEIDVLAPRLQAAGYRPGMSRAAAELALDVLDGKVSRRTVFRLLRHAHRWARWVRETSAFLASAGGRSASVCLANGGHAGRLLDRAGLVPSDSLRDAWPTCLFETINKWRKVFLDYSRRPPEYNIGYYDGWWWSAGDVWNESPLPSVESAVAEAWDHYKKTHDPPGLWTDHISDISRERPWGFLCNDMLLGQADSKAAARVKAWEWFDLRRATWSKEQELALEDWCFQGGGDMPEVFYA